MSRNDWEAGTLTLPTAAIALLRKALRDAANAYHAATLAECLKLWAGPLAKTSSAKLYLARLHDVAIARQERQADREDHVFGAAYQTLRDIVGASHHGPATGSPRTPRATDVDRHAPRANTRTADFGQANQWSIRIDGAKVHYSSGDNNRAAAGARAHPVVAAFFRQLERTAWTRGTGGVLTGNDEYNREDRGSGGGSNYITADYGPKGTDERAYAFGVSPARYKAMMGGKPTQRR